MSKLDSLKPDRAALAEARRIRYYEDAFGVCTCETLGVCPLCVALRSDSQATFNAAATGPWSSFMPEQGEWEDR